jgi:nucleoside-diphosphate-sugar epimerase
MQILITGGAGFLGARLARTLLAGEGRFAAAGGPARPIERIVLADRVAPPADLCQNPRVRVFEGDLLEQLQTNAMPLRDCSLIFHLAAAVSGDCEADLDLGLRSNVETTLALLQACRYAGHVPVLVFSSSVAVFGASASEPLPPQIDDTTLPTPQSSYGIQKFIGEQLVADFTRKGHVQGRIVRLMTVSVRPGRPNGAASSFLSGILREPLAGQRATCPVAPETEVALASPANTVGGLLRAAGADEAEWGARTAMNLPALTTTVGEMVATLERLGGTAAAHLIDWVPDARIADIVTRWPSRVRAERAARLGLHADPDFEAVLRAYIDENRGAMPALHPHPREDGQ